MATQAQPQIELPQLEGFYRTHLGFYVADHKAPANRTWPETAEHICREGAILIPNTYWSMVATLAEEDLKKIENPDIQEETRKAQKLMLAYPAQFVNLMVIGNRALVEPYGIGIKVLPEKLREGYIEVYDHDVSKIKLGSPQGKYFDAKLYVAESAKDDDVRFAVRPGHWGVTDWRFRVHLSYGPRRSDPDVAGLGFRPEGNHAYLDVSQVLEELKNAGNIIQAAIEHLE